MCDTVDMKWKGSVVRSIKIPTKHDQDKRHRVEGHIFFSNGWFLDYRWFSN